MTTLASTQQGLTQVYGAQGTPIPGVFQPPVIASRDPTSSDYNFKVGRQWVNKATPSMWFLGSKASNTATWIAAGSGATGGVITLTGDSGGAVSPLAGNIDILGTASEIDVVGTANTLTVSLPAAVVAPGSLTTTTTLAATTTVTGGTGVIATTGNITATAGAVSAGTTVTGGTGVIATTGGVTATAGNITATNGNLVLTAAGNKMVRTSVASTTTAGANSIGTVTLVGGTATVNTTAVTASSIIQLSRQGIGATGAAALGILTVGTITAGASFVINAVQAADATALQATDVSSIAWEIIN